nr:helix-turn-helix domain-containing protein [Marinicella sp. W31]MDC2880020.1 helix-turn-helix domain-containing protein [Marinicella sp. W31]
MNQSDRENEPHRKRRGRPRQDAGDFSTGHERPFVLSLARGISILRVFRAEDHVLGTQAVVERTGLHKTTVSRLLCTLTRLGYLRYLPEYGKYAVSNQVLTLGYSAVGRFGFIEAVRSHMDRIAENGDCGVALSVRDGTEMMFVELVRRPSAVALNLNVGSRIPVCETAPGRACLASMSAEERAEVFASLAARYGETFENEKSRCSRRCSSALPATDIPMRLANGFPTTMRSGLCFARP